MNVPACSTCGLGVAWLRSCYQSEWHLFRDDPSVKTRGRYYFCDPGTPCVSGIHQLGSRNWHDRNNGLVQGLGEDLTTVQKWDRGDPPAQVPFPRIVGSAACIAQGELLADAIPVDQLIDGFPPLCFVPEPEDDALWQIASSFNRCALQRFYARILDWLYVVLEGRIEDAFAELLGPTVTTKVHPSAGLLPGVVTVIHPRFAIAVIDGTRQFQQFAMQAFQSVRRPTNIGAFGTLPLWFAASQRVHELLVADGIQPNSKVMLVGHSYGGAAGLVLAARYTNAGIVPLVRYLTFAVPKPGDQRLRTILDDIEGVNLANDSDIVTMLPPDAITLQPVAIALGLPELAVWADWIRPPNQTRQNADGSLDPNGFLLLDYSTLLALALRALIDQEFDPIPIHYIGTYFERISLRCPDVIWPINDEVFVLLESIGDLRFDSHGGTEVGGNAILPYAEQFPSKGGTEVGGNAVITDNAETYSCTTNVTPNKFFAVAPGPWPGIAVGKNMVGSNWPVGTTVTSWIPLTGIGLASNNFFANSTDDVIFF